jgi:hypothetical protein
MAAFVSVIDVVKALAPERRSAVPRMWGIDGSMAD